MNRVITIFLVLLAAITAAFLFIFESRWTSTREDEAVGNLILHFDPQSVRKIRIVSGDNSFEIEKRNSSWWIGPKPKDMASPQKVAELLRAAKNVRVFDRIHANELDLDDFGLKKPKNQIDFLGDFNATLYFGKDAASENRVYVRRNDLDDIFVVSDELQQLAFRNPQDFRDRRLTNLTPDQIDKFTIKRKAGELSLERGIQGWEIVRPLHARADDTVVEKLLKDLLGLQIVDFVADESNDLSAYGLDQVRAELILSVDGEVRPMALRIGSKTTNKNILAQFTGRDSVYYLPEQAWTLLQVNPDDLRDREITNLNMDGVDAIRFGVRGKEKVIERKAEAWKLDGREFSDEEVIRQVHTLTKAKVLQYLPLTDKNLHIAGLDQPSAVISFDAWLSENTPEANAGRHSILTLSIGHQDADKAYVRVNEDPEICIVSAITLDILRLK